MRKILQPEGWRSPRGYSNGILAQGPMVFTGGIIGWDENEEIHSDHLADQVRQALLNTVAVLNEADAKPEHIVRMTWYVTDKQAYLDQGKEIGKHYREILGKNFPAMALVQVLALVEDKAKVEIETTAVIS
ncbi:MAG: RidA family protein [Arenicella sp.]|jgi:enamine deaminase RidA (YjgF/YER057c/UK114 family)|nr:RidA family protein [Arenicella sp.]